MGDQRGNLIRRLVVGLGAPVILLTVASGWGYARFGSFSNTIAFLRGQSLRMEETAKVLDVEKGKPFEIEYRISNLSPRPVKLVGAQLSCECTSIAGLPMTLAPSETRDLKINVSAPEGPDDSSGTIHLFTDADDCRTIDLAFTGHIKPGTPSGR